MTLSREERLAEFFRRLGGAPPATSMAEAMALLAETLNAVEEEGTDIPFRPDRWQTDGRMYPPQEDNRRTTPGYPKVWRFRSLKHNTFVSECGGIEIQMVENARVVFSKSDSTGGNVWEC